MITTPPVRLNIYRLATPRILSSLSIYLIKHLKLMKVYFQILLSLSKLVDYYKRKFRNYKPYLYFILDSFLLQAFPIVVMYLLSYKTLYKRG